MPGPTSTALRAALLAMVLACMPCGTRAKTHCFFPGAVFEELTEVHKGDTGESMYEFGAADLSECSSLELTGARCHDQGCLAIADQLSLGAELGKLQMANNGITDRCVERIARVLQAPNGVNMIELDLNGNQIGDKGAAALVKMLAKNSKLRKLNLGSNVIGQEMQKALLAFDGPMPSDPAVKRSIIIEEQGGENAWGWHPRRDADFMASPEGAKYRELMQRIDDAQVPDSGPQRWIADAKEFVDDNFTAQRILALVGVVNILHMLSKTLFGGGKPTGKDGEAKKDA